MPWSNGSLALELGDAFDPRAAQAIVASGLHRLTVPSEAGGLGASMADAAEVLARVGAVDGSTGLGFAMQVHVVGALRDATGVPDAIRDRVYRAIVEDGALVNNAATEDGGGSPARGAIPGTTARPGDDGTWRLTGEKTWTTWLPNLSLAFVTARIAGDAEPPEVGRFLVDLRGPGVERREGFEALGMRGSASGRLALDDVEAALVSRNVAGAPDPRGPATGAWFGAVAAATYLGIGEGARTAVARWALGHRPGDGSTSVADLPSVRIRLGRLDADLRAARHVLLGAARQWDDARDPADLAAGQARLYQGRRVGDGRGAPDRRRPRVPRRTARAGVPRRARRADQSAARGRRPGRVRRGAARAGARLGRALASTWSAMRRAAYAGGRSWIQVVLVSVYWSCAWMRLVVTTEPGLLVAAERRGHVAFRSRR